MSLILKEPNDDKGLNEDVPFQTESNQERIKGQQLRNLVDRLEATGLAQNVNIINDSQSKEILDRIKSKEDYIDTPNALG